MPSKEPLETHSALAGGSDGIEVTDPMARAGAKVLRSWDRRIEDDEALCELIFLAMLDEMDRVPKGLSHLSNGLLLQERVAVKLVCLVSPRLFRG